MRGRAEPDFSLSGLKTAVRIEAQKLGALSNQDVADLCASFQAAVVDVVGERVGAGLRQFQERFGAPSALVVAGGVGANQAVRDALRQAAAEAQTRFAAPPPEFCTDNGAIVAWAGAERLARGLTDDLTVSPRARWPLDQLSQIAPVSP
jgi:N6-L-threonylcarbamoyladenine synthase